MQFAADFGRRLDYYTGFVFEMTAAGHDLPGQIVGGGRYDKLLRLLGAPHEVPAVGFSLWLDRLQTVLEARA
ncbi:ATP phosphoribosyltransferase regulatory subunit [Pannonibacter sp. Pt2-lr]